MTDEKPARVIRAKFALRQLEPMTDDEAHRLGFPYNAGLPPDPAQATATVTITLSREDALWWRNVIDEPHTWGNPGEAQRVLSAVVAALTAAPPPAPSELEQAFRDAESKGVHHYDITHRDGRYIVFVDGDGLCESGRGKTLESALRQAIAAGRSAGKGTSDE